MPSMDKPPDQENPTPPSDQPPSDATKYDNLKKYAKYGTAIAVGVTAPIVAVPVVLSFAGFGAGGIAAGSVAAKLMSLSATMGYGATFVAAGQSIGAAGMAASTTVGLGTLGGYAGKKIVDKAGGRDFQYLLMDKMDKDQENPIPLSNSPPSGSPSDASKYDNLKKYAKYGTAIAVGVTAPIVAIPAVLSFAGFGAGGIAAGSVASKLMSLSTTLYGAPLPLVAASQSIGAVGSMALPTTVGLGSLGGYAGKKVVDEIEGEKNINPNTKSKL